MYVGALLLLLSLAGRDLRAVVLEILVDDCLDLGREGGRYGLTLLVPGAVPDELLQGLWVSPALLKSLLILSSQAPHGVPAALPLTCDPAVRNATADVTDDVSSFHVVDHLPDFLRSEVSNTSMIDYWSLFDGNQ